MLDNWLLFGHVLLVVVWVGGGVWTQVYATPARRAASPEVLVASPQRAAWAGTRVLTPAAPSTFAFGVALVAVGPDRLQDPWVTLGGLGIAATPSNGGAVLAPVKPGAS